MNNPHAAAARAAIMSYNAQMRGETAPEQPDIAPAPADPDAALIEAVMQRWPDMRQYQHTAEIGEVVSLLNGTVKPRVTVTVFERESEKLICGSIELEQDME